MTFMLINISSFLRYRYQLEAFVNKVRDREAQAWPASDEPAYQMEWVDEIYRVSGMPSRQHSVSP
jgi:hypothetical protein